MSHSSVVTELLHKLSGNDFLTQDGDYQENYKLQTINSDPVKSLLARLTNTPIIAPPSGSVDYTGPPYTT